MVDADVARAGSHIIKRPRLTRLLDNAESRLILLLAPAGYGKTTLARQWLERGDRRVAWYSASPASADVAALAAGLAHAIDPILPNAGKRVVERLRVSQNPQLEARLLAEMFAEDVAGWPEGAWLCVDDYQFLMEAEAAEEFFEVVVTRAPVRVLVTSRDRPKWATARRVLYGELHEIGRDGLALTRVEARRLLAPVRLEESGVIEMANGWPAVLGLAALATGGRLPAPDAPGELYDYFAQELFERVEGGLKRHLFEIALMPPITESLASRLFGVPANRILSEMSCAGFLTSDRSGSWSLHPLLRAFLLRRFSEERESFRHELVGDVGEILIRERHWDDVFSLVEREGAVELHVELLESSFAELLAAGRLATLRRWIDFAQRHSIDVPVIDLVDAELSLRAASYGEAETLSVRAARHLPRRSQLLSRAWLVAGRAAHMNDRRQSALTYLDQAARHASSEYELDDALWVRFVASKETEDPELEPVLEHLRRVASDLPEHELRVAMGAAMLAERQGDLRTAVDSLLAVRTLARRVTDPMTRSVYLNRLAYVLTLVARYKEAIDVAEECLTEARQHRLDFVLQHGLPTLAGAHLGLRHFNRARNFLAEALAAAANADDTYLRLNARALMARLLLAQQRPAAALEATAEPPEVSNAPVRGEYLATRALALAISGSWAEGDDLARSILTDSSPVETRSFALWVEAVIAISQKMRDADKKISNALAHTAASGHADALVCAYRGYPPLLAAVASIGPASASVAAILRRAGDDVLARQVGIAVRYEPKPISGLTRREQEVHALLSEGLTNREIAERLFISEPTAKVHVRHILEKLGARSRTEAVVLPYRESGDRDR